MFHSLCGDEASLNFRAVDNVSWQWVWVGVKCLLCKHLSLDPQHLCKELVVVAMPL